MEPIWKNLGWIALAGALGTLCRYGAELGVSRFAPKNFPWSIALINLLGCFLFGWVWSFSTKRMIAEGPFRLILMVGFLGAFTTFSTYAFQSLQLLSAGRVLAGLGYITLNNLGGFAMAALGMAIGSR